MRKIKLNVEKIKELYLSNKLSIRKIAKEMKVSYGTIRKNMILSEVQRKPSKKRDLLKPNKEELEKVYCDGNKSVKDVLKQFDVGLTTLFKWLKEYKIKPQRRWKYNKTPFSGDEKEKAYILGLVAGDIHAGKHNRQILAELTSTHPAMIDLFFNVFKKYGTPKKYIKHNKKLERNEWGSYVLLDSSFEFMLSESYDIESNFDDFLAGFFDCEGCLYVYNNHNNIGLNWSIYNSDRELLERIKKILETRGLNPKSHLFFKKGDKTTNGYFRGADLWALSLYTKEEVIRIMTLLPIKHKEKIDKFEIVKSLKDWRWETISGRLKAYKEGIKLEVQAFVNNPVKNEGSRLLQ